jgi:ribosomal protein L30E
MSNPYGVYPITSYIPSKEEIGKLTEKYFPVSCIRILKKIIFDNLFY